MHVPVLILLILCLSQHVLANWTTSEPMFPDPSDSARQTTNDPEHPLASRDEIIRQLERRIQHQNDDFMELKQRVVELEQLVTRLNSLSIVKSSTGSSKFSRNLRPGVSVTNDLDLSVDSASRVIDGSTKENRVSSLHSVAFHSYLSSTVTIGTQATVVFNHESLDLGNGYNPSDGIYTVPESGVYVFSWTILCDLHKAFQTQLVVNGVVMGTSYTDSDEINDYHQTSQSVVLVLSQGDHVFVRVGDVFRDGKAVVKSDSTLARPTFSCWKLQ